MFPIYATGALNPRGHYVSGMGTGQLNALRTAFERMTDVDIAAEAMLEVQTFHAKSGSFSTPSPRKWRLMVKCRLVCIFNFIYLHPMY
jgi:hypothetical protein